MIPIFINKLVPKISKYSLYALVFWIMFLLGRSLWQNWDLKHSIWKLNDQISILEKQKVELENLNLYYQSDTFKELEARKKLGLKKADEKMVILADSSSNAALGNFPDEIKKEKESVAGIQAPTRIPNWLLWWQYFTK